MTLIFKPVILGTYAFMLPAKELEKRRAKGDAATHEWTCLLRSPTNEDLSTFIRKVTFVLHPSFALPQRTIETQPYEVSEVGWGEFEIVCRLHFVDPDEKPVELKHYLRLYPDSTVDIRSIAPPETQRESCVAVELYDEIVFRRPSERLLHSLTSRPPAKLPPHPLAQHFLPPPIADEMQYLNMSQLLSREIMNKSEALKAEIEQRVLEVEALMDLFYCLQPEQALEVLLADPQLLKLLADGSPSAISQVRQGLKVLNNKAERPGGAQEVVQLFSQLVANQSIRWTGQVATDQP